MHLRIDKVQANAPYSILTHATNVLFRCRVSCMVAVNGIASSAIVCLGYPLKVIYFPDKTPVHLTNLYFISNSCCSLLMHVNVYFFLFTSNWSVLMIDLEDLCLILLKLRKLRFHLHHVFCWRSSDGAFWKIASK